MNDTKLLRLEVLRAGAMDIRDVDDKGETPFLYASGNHGPGYISIKGLVGRKQLFKGLAKATTEKVAAAAPHINFVAGNVTGGVVPGWLVSEDLEALLGRTVPFVYVRESRKKGGQKELITGLKGNPEIKAGDNALIAEELVNFSETTCNTAVLLRAEGYTVTHGVCILFYNNPKAVELLHTHGVEMVYLFTLPELLETAEREGTHSPKLIGKYREFLADPLGWQSARGLTRVEKGGTL
ncbi:MAG: hypothetical protein Q7R93_04935 [bacterium]|nr:hypothetical protein [bacterium]